LPLFARIGQKGHKAGALDRPRYRVLAGGRASALPATDDLALSIRELFQQFHVFVIDIDWTGTLAVDEDRVFLLRVDLRLRAPFADFVDLKPSSHGIYLSGSNGFSNGKGKGDRALNLNFLVYPPIKL